MPLDAAQVPVKYQRPKDVRRPGLTIWEVPGEGLYRAVESDPDQLAIGTLTQLGWTELISFERGEAHTPVEALQVCLRIQTPVAKADAGGNDNTEAGE
ncbi:hypothetical protein ACFRAU_07280 [Arthrobacter sp. NPDC056691]|uniref:hypothetical protein n=1 Tax=Arthrobacter sp. NPDC056691 TaxID=3345913 RepID=UPI00366C756D